MARSRRFATGALALVAATLLAQTACTSSVTDTWHLRAEKGTAAVGERVRILSVEKQINVGCLGTGSDSRMIAPQDLDWTVAPSTGRVVKDYFAADEPGTYKLTPIVTAAAARQAPGASAGAPLGPTLTIRVTAAEIPAGGTTGGQAPAGETQMSVDPSPSSTGAPLAGTWTYAGMLVRGTGAGATWSYSPNQGVLVIEKRGDGYYLQISEGDSKAVLTGDKVVLERNFPSQGISVRYEGVLSGDTITGSQHTVAAGASNDSPWTATRQK